MFSVGDFTDIKHIMYNFYHGTEYSRSIEISKMAQNGQIWDLGSFWSPIGSWSIGSGDESHTLYVLYSWNLLPKRIREVKTDYIGRKSIFFIFLPFSYIFLVKIHTFLNIRFQQFPVAKNFWKKSWNVISMIRSRIVGHQGATPPLWPP